jgi:hypothetical protein
MGDHAEPIDVLIRLNPKRRRERRASAVEVEARRALVARGYTARTIEWLTESGALDD